MFGTAFSRVTEGLHRVDITKDSELSASIKEFRPDIIIHTAAQRYPDKVDKDPEAAKQLNVEATRTLCTLAKQQNVPVIYISTDYVFDGKKAPYKESDEVNPVNLYGETKLQGERETLKISPDNLCLRVPVLYGPVTSLAESAVTCLLSLLTRPDTAARVSDYERRNPSHVDDIATVLHQLSLAKVSQKQSDVKGIYQWCGAEVLTKYQMVQAMAQVFHLPMDHITGVRDAGPSGGVVRPYDTRLDVARLRALGFGQHTPFEKGIEDALKSWI